MVRETKRFKEKKADLKKLPVRILHKHKELDKTDKVRKIQEPFRQTLVDDKERHKCHVKRIEEEPKKITHFYLPLNLK